MKHQTNRIRKNHSHKSTRLQARNLIWNVPELKICSLRECPMETGVIDVPAHLEKFWREHIETDSHFNSDVESLWVFLLDMRFRLIGFHQISQGTKDTILVDPSLVFRAAIVQNAASIVLAHNHPSGDSSPSDQDITLTRQLVQGGKLLKITLLDHLVIGSTKFPLSFMSLRTLGHCA